MRIQNLMYLTFITNTAFIYLRIYPYFTSFNKIGHRKLSLTNRIKVKTKSNVNVNIVYIK